jgi:hypothetical protein
MPTLTQLPPGFEVVSSVDDQGCVVVSIVVDHMEVSRYAFSQSVAEMRAERERHARAATTPANLHYWPQQED